MAPEEKSNATAGAGRAFAGKDVADILRERGWLAAEPSAAEIAWCERAASLLGSHAADRHALAGLLGLIFHYDAAELLTKTETHAVLARYAARDVLRRLALLLLDDSPLTSELFKKVISCLKDDLDLRGRELFHPLRLALAGRAGEGELDRVILLLDEAAGLSFVVPVKPARERILEFCAALD
jgi:nondiscriminating glutamyl-tRNA synthetase